MRIAIFTDTYFPHINGVAKTVDRYINYLDGEGHEYVIFLPKYPGDEKDVEEVVRQKFKRMTAFKFIFYPDLRLSIVSLRAVKRALDEFKPDVIQVMTEFPIGRAGMKYGKRYGVPVVSCFETNVPEYMSYYGFGFLTPACWKFFKYFHYDSDLIITPSQMTTDLLYEHGFSKVRTWNRGIEFDKFNPEMRNLEFRRKYAKDDQLIVIYIGRVSAEKDLDIYLDTAKAIRKKHGEKVQFIITGGGPKLEELQQHAPEYVIFTGFVSGDDLYKLYANADIFLFPSPTETLGYVILEAMASELAVVACYEGGIKGIIQDGVNGIACRQKVLEDYIEATERLINDPELRARLAKKGREHAQTRSWENSFKELISMYEGLIAQGKEPMKRGEKVKHNMSKIKDTILEVNKEE